MSLLLAAGVDDRFEIGGEAFAALAPTSQRRLAPQHDAAQSLLCVVVGRIDGQVKQPGQIREGTPESSRSPGV